MVRAVSSRLPRLFETLRTYDSHTFARDALADLDGALLRARAVHSARG
jgi:hypothetical protein